MKETKDIKINWNIVKILFLSWLGSLAATITIRIAMFKILMPIIILLLATYLGYCTWVWWASVIKQTED